jgi:hypothetical protein
MLISLVKLGTTNNNKEERLMAELMFIALILISAAIILPIYAAIERATIRRKIRAHKKIKNKNK